MHVNARHLVGAAIRNVERFRNSSRGESEGRPHITSPDTPEPVLRINRLLDAEAVDLSRIGQEIRSQPELDSLVMRMATSLALSPADSVQTLEEAVVVMGTDRLRVVLYMWSLLRQKTGEVSSARAVREWNPEALYLASFLRYLGLDSPGAANLHSEMFSFALDPQRGEFADLRDMLMRDFLALVPVLDPLLLKAGAGRPSKS